LLTTGHDDFDPYAVLRVPRSADRHAIRAAYRALARLYHPDLATSDAAHRQMVEINRAWAVLGDPATRAEWDRARFPAGPTAAGTTPAWMARQGAHRRGSGTAEAGAAGPPPGRPSGSVLDFGIYRGWSLGEVERRDAEYLDWLAERPEGRPFQREILAIQARRSRPPGAGRRRRFGFG
jgi:curved DNA-binding protein CbpA